MARSTAQLLTVVGAPWRIGQAVLDTSPRLALVAGLFAWGAGVVSVCCVVAASVLAMFGTFEDFLAELSWLLPLGAAMASAGGSFVYLIVAGWLDQPPVTRWKLAIRSACLSSLPLVAPMLLWVALVVLDEWLAPPRQLFVWLWQHQPPQPWYSTWLEVANSPWWLAAVFAGWLAMSVIAYCTSRKRLRHPRWHCPGCFYDLRGCPSPIVACPECGHRFASG